MCIASIEIEGQKTEQFGLEESDAPIDSIEIERLEPGQFALREDDALIVSIEIEGMENGHSALEEDVDHIATPLGSALERKVESSEKYHGSHYEKKRPGITAGSLSFVER